MILRAFDRSLKRLAVEHTAAIGGVNKPTIWPAAIIWQPFDQQWPQQHCERINGQAKKNEQPESYCAAQKKRTHFTPLYSNNEMLRPICILVRQLYDKRRSV